MDKFLRPAQNPFGARETLSRRALLRGAASGALIAGAAASFPAARALAQGDETDNVLVVTEAILDDMDAPVPTYNKVTPGPTFFVDPGKRLRLNLFNALEPYSDREYGQLCPKHDEHNTIHGVRTTNFHTHGLHVSPNRTGQFDADNIFLRIYPQGQTFPPKCEEPERRRDKRLDRIGRAQFAFDLPDDHPSGTFWYHAHVHGSTNWQVASGLLGPLIVRDTEKSMPRYIRRLTDEDQDEVYVIQMRNTVLPEIGPKNFPTGTDMLVRADPSGGGEKNPTLRIRRGEAKRVRIINGAVRENAFFNFSVGSNSQQGPKIYRIAYDGMTANKRYEVRNDYDGDEPWQNPNSVAPGNRIDFIVYAPPEREEGKFDLVMNPVAVGSHGGTDHAALKATQITLPIEISGAKPNPDRLDQTDELPGYRKENEPQPDSRTPRKVVFSVDGESENCKDFPCFKINDEEYTGRPLFDLKHGATEIWRLENSSNAPHPFHIHVNPFFVTHINGRLLDKDDELRRWQDTIAVPPKQGDTNGSIDIVSHYGAPFKGDFVIHCHILLHEDRGMMQKVRIV